jgi:hypothetical protein
MPIPSGRRRSFSPPDAQISAPESVPHIVSIDSWKNPLSARRIAVHDNIAPAARRLELARTGTNPLTSTMKERPIMADHTAGGEKAALCLEDLRVGR